MTTLTDAFTTADSATLGGSLTWTETSSAADWKIVSNTVHNAGANASAPADARAETDLSGADNYGQVVLSAVTTITARGGALARFDSTARTYYGFWARNNTTTTYRLIKCVAGTQTVLTSVSTTAPTIPATLKLEVTTVGGNAVLVGKVAGVQVITWTDSSSPILTGLRAGMFYEGCTAADTVTLDSFEAGDMGVAPLSASATGSTTSTGTATATLTEAATATGATTSTGAAAVTLTLAAAATGSTTTTGAATASVTLAATATGTTTTTGSAAATISGGATVWAATATGTTTTTGTATATITTPSTPGTMTPNVIPAASMTQTATVPTPTMTGREVVGATMKGGGS